MKSADTAVIEGLAAEIFALLAGVPEAAFFRAEFPELRVSRASVPGSLPVCAGLAEAVRHAVPLTCGLMQSLVCAAPQLEWRQTYSAEDFGPEFLRGYGWSEVIGLRGPIASDRVACGFLMLGPDTTYPAHAHEAEELYLPLAGTALWQHGTGEYAAIAPGEAIYHPSWLPHATTTQSQPLLALYIWRGGNLAAKSTIIGRV